MLWLLAFDVSTGHQLPLKYLYNISLRREKRATTREGVQGQQQSRRRKHREAKQWFL